MMKQRDGDKSCNNVDRPWDHSQCWGLQASCGTSKEKKRVFSFWHVACMYHTNNNYFSDYKKDTILVWQEKFWYFWYFASLTQLAYNVCLIQVIIPFYFIKANMLPCSSIQNRPCRNAFKKGQFPKIALFIIFCDVNIPDKGHVDRNNPDNSWCFRVQRRGRSYYLKLGLACWNEPCLCLDLSLV